MRVRARHSAQRDRWTDRQIYTGRHADRCVSLCDCEQIHRNNQCNKILHLITNLDLNTRSNEIPEAKKLKRRKKFQSNQSHFNKYNAHGSYCACWLRHEEGECASPDGVRSVVSGRVEHGEDTHEAEGLIVELNCHAQCLVSSLIQ